MIIGIDIDGVLTKKDWSTKLPDIFSYLTYVAQIFVPKLIKRYILEADVQKGLSEFRQACQDHEIVVITARPKFVEKETREWLTEHLGLPIKGLHCVGLTRGIARRKFEAAQKEQVELFIDNRVRTVKYFNENGIEAIRFTSWADVPIKNIC
jgi:uncharacterized HAD superfamily protein